MKAKYIVVFWGTWDILFATNYLSTAKKVARNQGHTGRPYGKLYPSVAVVKVRRDSNFIKYELLYTPRFLVGKDDDFKPIKVNVMDSKN